MARQLIEEGKYHELLELLESCNIKDQKFVIEGVYYGYGRKCKKTLFMIYLENPCQDKQVHQKIIDNFIPIMRTSTTNDKFENIFHYLENEDINPSLIGQIIKDTGYYSNHYNLKLVENETFYFIYQQALNRERKLEKRIFKLEQIIDDHLKYSPDGEGAREAKNDFNNQLNIKDKVDNT